MLAACQPHVAAALPPAFTLAPIIAPEVRVTVPLVPTRASTATRVAVLISASTPTATATDSPTPAPSATRATPCPKAAHLAAGPPAFTWPTDAHYVSGFEFDPVKHPGLDLFAPLGAPVYAAEVGVVAFAGWSEERGYGNLILLQHAEGWQTAYGHLSDMQVGCGVTVERGAVIGLAGDTGRAGGVHLHFEVLHAGVRQNPWLSLPPPLP